MLIGRLRERNKFEAAIHDKELKSGSYSDEEEIANFFDRIASTTP